MSTDEMEFYKKKASELKKRFALSDYEAVRLIQQSELNGMISKFTEDFRAANVITNSIQAPTALEKIAMVLEERLHLRD